MSLIVDAFVMSLVNEYRRKTTTKQSTPLLTFTFEQILERNPTSFLIAKCAECTLRKELGTNMTLEWKRYFINFKIEVVCPECERVICFECISQHQLIINDNIQQNWTKCKEIWNSIYEKSSNFCFLSSFLF